MVSFYLRLISNHRIKIILGTFFLVLSVAYYFCLPKPLFYDPYSTVLDDRNGQLLGAMIAADGQWRFPMSDTLPAKFTQCLVNYEDQYFYNHFGVNPYSLYRAAFLNIKFKRVVAGGSTISMQLIRLSRKGKPRNVWQKMIEIVLATRAELGFSKENILKQFAAHAPFGGNVVGLEAAAWRYFGRSSNQLSWAEAATLAVLPNAPALIYPGHNQTLLLNKRNRLLLQLLKKGIIDTSTYELSVAESLPLKPLDLPRLAPHLVSRVYGKTAGTHVQTSIDRNKQLQLIDVVDRNMLVHRANEIFNAAVLIADVESGEVLAYVGNAKTLKGEDHGNAVDIVTASRSTGSILKPFLYAATMDAGIILPGTLLPDVPLMYNGYSPKNFSNTFDGAVHAQQALSRSLNIPAVFLLREYGIPRFYNLLQSMGFSTIKKQLGHYGLSLILGGAETSLWETASMYASMARTLNHFHKYNGKYNLSDWRLLTYQLKIADSLSVPLVGKSFMSAAASWLTFNAMLEVNKPQQQNGWEYFLSARNVAWKTGTSFGFRDAWAIGVTPKYVVAVWVGNADGTGRPGLTGVGSAAPIMFEVFRGLPSSAWFEAPWDELRPIAICRNSGHRPNEFCDLLDTVWVHFNGVNTEFCPYHKLIHLNATGRYQVTDVCESPLKMKHLPWFVLPPLQEWYYKKKESTYKSLPPYRSDCLTEQQAVMAFIYPHASASIYVPVNLNAQKGQTVFEVAHREASAIIYWHLDGEYIGLTQYIHQMALSPSAGKHDVVLVDEIGNSITAHFLIMQ